MISLQSVTKLFGSFVAVDDVSLEVRAGEFLTLLGPSGCGKTTLLRMISGFERPSRGRVVLDGRDVTELPPYQRDVNQVFQSYALFPHLSVWENIAFGLRSRRVPKADSCRVGIAHRRRRWAVPTLHSRRMPEAEIERQVGEALGMVGLNGMERRKPSQLSGGQRQRVALARALVCEPKVLLLDEPLAALDAKLRRAMQLELKKLQQRLGITFVFVTHDQDEAIVMSDRIAVINGGKIEQIGAAAEIYRKPATRFVADFLGQANLISVSIVERNAEEKIVRAGNSLQLRVRGNDCDAAELLACIRPEKIVLGEALEGENTFTAEVVEEVFRGATTQVILKMADGLTLISVGVRSWGKGKRVTCKVEAEAVVLLGNS